MLRTTLTQPEKGFEFSSGRRIKADRVGAEKHKHRIGEHLAGDRRETSPYELSFNDDVEWRLLCKTTLGSAELNKLKEAIHNNYFFEMFIEDLPMWGYVGDFEDEDAILGEMDGSHTYLFPHLHFKVGTHKSQIVSVTVTTERDRRVDITNVHKPTTVTFSYSVEWFEDDLPWKHRMTRYADSRFLPGSFEIHWLSIINSFVLVLLLTAFLTIILMRVLKNDFSRYMELDDESLEEEEVSLRSGVEIRCFHFLIQYRNKMIETTVWMETDPRGCIPLSGIPGPILRIRRHWCAACGRDFRPFRSGTDELDFDHETRFDFGGHGHSLLPDVLHR